MKKIIFFDVDGTLCQMDGTVPQSAKEAIKEAQAQGHKMYLCTGRSRPEITSELLAMNFDGIIGAGGGYIEKNEEVLVHKKLPADAVKDIIAYFDEHQIGYYLESNDGLFASDNCQEVIEHQVLTYYKGDRDALAGTQSFLALLAEATGKEMNLHNVNKISFISIDHPFDKVAQQFGERFLLHHSTVPQFGPQSGELSMKGVDKQTAIEYVLNAYQLTSDDAIAFGDGNNDIAMFQAVGYAIAMENATDELKKYADAITARAEDDGIAKSFAQLGLMS